MFYRINRETRHTRVLSVGLASAIALVLGGGVPTGRAQNHPANQTIPFADARIRIELNGTAEDVGIQVDLDAEAWNSVQIVSPNGRKVFDRRLLEVEGEGNLQTLGLTELFFESEEPPLTELPLATFFELFPEGEYLFFGKTVEGKILFSKARFTHVIPASPQIVSPTVGKVLDPNQPVVIDWEPVTTTFPGSSAPSGVKIDGYQVIVIPDQPGPKKTFDIKLPATATEVTVPPEFILPGVPYKFEVLAIEESGNQTIAESNFRTGI
jgi:hypothetical protein